MFEQLVKEVISDISQREDRQRNRRDDAQHHFEYAVRYLLADLWKAFKREHFNSTQADSLFVLSRHWKRIAIRRQPDS